MTLIWSRTVQGVYSIYNYILLNTNEHMLRRGSLLLLILLMMRIFRRVCQLLFENQKSMSLFRRRDIKRSSLNNPRTFIVMLVAKEIVAAIHHHSPRVIPVGTVSAMQHARLYLATIYHYCSCVPVGTPPAILL